MANNTKIVEKPWELVQQLSQSFDTQTFGQVVSTIEGYITLMGACHPGSYAARALLMKSLQNLSIPNYCPVLPPGAWEDWFSEIEAQSTANSKSRLNVFLFISGGEKNAVLGSWPEVMLTIVSSLMRGQKLWVYVSREYLASMTKSSTVMLVEAGMNGLAMLQEKYPEHIKLIESSETLKDLKRLAKAIAQEYHQGISVKPALNVDNESLFDGLFQRQAVVISGAGAPLSKRSQKEFWSKYRWIFNQYPKKDFMSMILVQGSMAKAWDQAYSLKFVEAGVQSDAGELLFLAESAAKYEWAERIAWALHGRGMAAAVELGQLLVHALERGIPMDLYVEPLNKNEAITEMIQVAFSRSTIQVEEFQEFALSRVAEFLVHEFDLSFNADWLGDPDMLDKLEIGRSLILDAVAGEILPYKTVSKSVLASTAVYGEVDDLRRVKALTLAVFDRLMADFNLPIKVIREIPLA